MRAKTRRTGVGRLFGIGVCLLLGAASRSAPGSTTRNRSRRWPSAAQRRNFVPAVRMATVKARATPPSALPGTTSAFATANIFARASGYVAKRYVDIGDRSRRATLLAESSAPELDHQISQAEATLAQRRLRNAGRPTRARERHLGPRRAAGQGRLGARQQGTVDVQTLQRNTPR